MRDEAVVLTTICITKTTEIEMISGDYFTILRVGCGISIHVHNEKLSDLIEKLIKAKEKLHA